MPPAVVAQGPRTRRDLASVTSVKALGRRGAVEAAGWASAAAVSLVGLGRVCCAAPLPPRASFPRALSRRSSEPLPARPLCPPRPCGATAWSPCPQEGRSVGSASRGSSPPALWGTACVRGPPRPTAPCSLRAVWPPGSSTQHRTPRLAHGRAAPQGHGRAGVRPPLTSPASSPACRCRVSGRLPGPSAGRSGEVLSPGEAVLLPRVPGLCCCPGRRGGQPFPRTLSQSGRLSWSCPLGVRVLRPPKQSAAPRTPVSPCFMAFLCAHHTCTRLGPGTAASRRTWRLPGPRTLRF